MAMKFSFPFMRHLLYAQFTKTLVVASRPQNPFADGLQDRHQLWDLSGRAAVVKWSNGFALPDVNGTDCQIVVNDVSLISSDDIE